MIEQLKNASQSPFYWLIYISAAVLLLVVALIFQHILEEQPCLMCIQVRLLLSLLVIVATIGWFLRSRHKINSVSHLFTVLIAAGLTERSYQLLGTERGFVFGDCGFNLGLPTWFAIDDWLPWLYRVETACGYTPELILGITMAEALMVMSALFLLLSFCVFLASFANWGKASHLT